MNLPRVTIYTDGGCSPNPGAGGWGAILIFADKTEVRLSDGELETTNNRMELAAVIAALDYLETPHAVDLYVDSQYVKDGLTKWMVKWKLNGWRTAGKELVKNQELWQVLDVATQSHQITWHWVRGHAGNVYNEEVDQLATEARLRVLKTGADKTSTRQISQISTSNEAPIPQKTPSEGQSAVFMRVVVPRHNSAGGWAVRIYQGGEKHEFSGMLPEVTSANELELRTARHIFSLFVELNLTPNDTIKIYCLSDYLHKGITRWIHGWQKNKWLTSSGSPVKYADVWQEISRLGKEWGVHWLAEATHPVAYLTQGLEETAQASLS
jgi:ribonuclease HI